MVPDHSAVGAILLKALPAVLVLGDLLIKHCILRDIFELRVATWFGTHLPFILVFCLLVFLLEDVKFL
jgi:hypothetical protein